jgi:pimeloyl-ACP methyl ester carboxylesterase
MHSALKHSILLSLAMMTAACLGLAPTEARLPSIQVLDTGARQDSVVVMLPGRGDRADTFIREGFEAAGKRFGFDTIAVDAHFGYYMQRSLLPRLHDDIILPARDAGYKNVWLLGISMGGFGSLLYAAEHPDMIDGVILLAPFLGERSGIEQIVAAGGLAAWNGEDSDFEDYEVAVWTWLRNATTTPAMTPVILAYGTSDKMAEGYRALTDVIDPSSVYTLEGGHKWTTWRPLWEQIAADLDL